MNNISNKLKNLKVAKQNENLVHGVMDVGGEDCGEDGDDEGCGEVCSVVRLKMVVRVVVKRYGRYLYPTIKS